MVVLTQKGGNENLTKNIFRVMGDNERSFILIKPQGNDRVMARLLPQNFVACLMNCAIKEESYIFCNELFFFEAIITDFLYE